MLLFFFVYVMVAVTKTSYGVQWRNIYSSARTLAQSRTCGTKAENKTKSW